MRLKIVGKKWPGIGDKPAAQDSLNYGDDWKFVDVDSGEELRGVKSFKLEMPALGVATATIELELSAVEIDELSAEVVPASKEDWLRRHGCDSNVDDEGNDCMTDHDARFSTRHFRRMGKPFREGRPPSCQGVRKPYSPFLDKRRNHKL